MLAGIRNVCIRDSPTAPPNSKMIKEKIKLLLPALKLVTLYLGFFDPKHLSIGYFHCIQNGRGGINVTIPDLPLEGINKPQHIRSHSEKSVDCAHIV